MLDFLTRCWLFMRAESTTDVITQQIITINVILSDVTPTPQALCQVYVTGG
jgi:hypothetical protein